MEHAGLLSDNTGMLNWALSDEDTSPDFGTGDVLRMACDL